MAGSPLLGLLAGLAQIPKLTQERKDVNQQRQFAQQDQQAKIAGEQAQTNLMVTQAAAAKEKAGNDFLMQRAQMIKARPDLAGNDTFTADTLSKAKTFGVDTSAITRTVNGKVVLDATALLPSKSYKDMDSAERMKYIAMDPATRINTGKSEFTDVDPKDPFWTQPAYEPLTAGEKTNLEMLPMKLDADLGTGKISPSDYISSIKANYAKMKQAGMDPDALLSPDALRHKATQLTEAKINQLEAAGIHLKNVDKTMQLKISEQMREFGIKEGDSNAHFSQRMSVEGTRISIAANNLAYRAMDVKMAEQRLDMAAQAQNLRVAGFAQSNYNDAFKALDAKYKPLTAEYDKITDQIRSLNASNSGYIPDDATLQRLSQLNQQINELKPKVEAARQNVVTSATRNFTSVSGLKAKPADNSTDTGSTNSAAKTVERGGKTYYLWSDGNYHTKKPS